jgi:hypothetical protein
VSTFSWLEHPAAATFDNLDRHCESNRALQNDPVAAYGHPAEIALTERLKMPTTETLVVA